MLGTGDPVPWERTADGNEVTLVRGRPIAAAGYGLKLLALDKLFAISMVSAEFDGDARLFEHRASVLIDYGAAAECYGIYEWDGDADSSSPCTPSFCLRHGKYDRGKDYAGFSMAADKLAYVLNNQTIESTICFHAASELRDVSSLLERAAEFVRAGFGFVQVNRAHSAVGGLKVAFDVKGVHIEMFYIPTSMRNDIIDTWVLDMEEAFRRAAILRRINPTDNRIRISFNSCLLDRLQRVQEGI